MKISSQSHNSIADTIKKAVEKYGTAKQSAITDIHLQPNPVTGELVIFNDDDEVLANVVVAEWVNANLENCYEDAEMLFKKILNQLRKANEFSVLRILKPYSFVLVDGEKETLAELMLVDDEDTLLLSGELLKGLDEELDTFLKEEAMSCFRDFLFS